MWCRSAGRPALELRGTLALHRPSPRSSRPTFQHRAVGALRSERTPAAPARMDRSVLLVGYGTFAKSTTEEPPRLPRRVLRATATSCKPVERSAAVQVGERAAKYRRGKPAC